MTPKMPKMIYDDDRPKGLGSHIWFMIFGFLAAVGVANIFYTNASIIIAMNILRAAASFTVVYVYWPDAVRGLRTSTPSREDFLIVGIVLSFLSNILLSLQGAIGRLAGLPAWFQQNEFFAYALVLSVVASALHVSAPGAVDGTVPRRKRIAVGIGLGLAVMGIVGIGLTQPDMGPLLEKVRPYISGAGGEPGGRSG